MAGKKTVIGDLKVSFFDSHVRSLLRPERTGKVFILGYYGPVVFYKYVIGIKKGDPGPWGHIPSFL